MWTEKLRQYKHEWSDDIPNQIVHEGKIKARKQFFQKVAATLENLLSDGQIPTKLKQEAEKFMKHYTSAEFQNQPLTTKKDINRANNLIKRILGE